MPSVETVARLWRNFGHDGNKKRTAKSYLFVVVDMKYRIPITFHPMKMVPVPIGKRISDTFTKGRQVRT